MKKLYRSTGVFFTAMFFMIACEDYVQNIDPLIDAIEDERLNNASQVDFLIKGLDESYARAQDQIYVMADGLSDLFFFDSNVPNATFPQFLEIDQGVIELDNNSVDNMQALLGEFRFYADDLIRRVNTISPLDADLKNKALFKGNFYGGLARYLYATYIGLNPTEGGGVINNGPFIPAAEMYDLALEKFTNALEYTDFDYSDEPVISDEIHAQQIVHSLLARLYLYSGDDANALLQAQMGLISGSSSFRALHFTSDGTTAGPDNFYYQQAGAGRAQYVVDYRFHDYVTADANEANRIQLDEITGNDDVTVYYIQVKYPEESSPLDCITWQENHLMLAELALKGQGTADPLVLVNEVRASHSIDPLGSIDLAGLIVEREKELFCTGSRLPDQRRFDLWHLAAGTWQYLPITMNERNENPNF
jgi:starch-binding outer membrane protein, SusD/RagB family